jgi:heptosyltransferase-2
MRNVLVIRGGAIGDFVLTVPVFEALRARYPDVAVDILGYPAIAQLAVDRRHARSVRRVDAAEWAALFSPEGELRDGERAWLRSFDAVFCIWPDADGVIRENLRKAGVARIASLNPIPSKPGRHAVEHLAAQCEGAGLPMAFTEPHLYPSERDRWWAERFMRVSGAGWQPLMGLNPGSGSRRKNWPAARFAELAAWWIDRRRGHVLVVAGPADDEALAEFQSAAPREGVFVLLNEELPRVAAAIERCEVYVGNDSGITHVAAAVRTPTVAIFGPTDPGQWAPRAPRVEVVTPPSGEDPGDIAVGEVISRALRLAAVR